jgi:SAM-dependent methyltransferase
MWLYMRDETDLNKAQLRIMHSAPEPQIQRHLAGFNNLKYTSVDIDSPLADTRVDLTALPMADDSFDVLICNHVLEHIPDDRKAMSELHRVLRPGGWSIISVPIDVKRESTYEDASVVTEEDRLREFGQADHVRIYGRDFSTRLKDSGFDVEELRFIDRFSSEEVQRYGLSHEDVIYRCSK